MKNKTLALNDTSTSAASNQSKSILFVYQNSTKVIKLSNDVSFLDPVLSLDNHAKEIILLSTAFVTMLLSTCFMLFLIWFCCYFACKNRNARKADKRVKKSIKETETNLNEIGLHLKQFDDKTAAAANDFEYLKTIPINSLKQTVEQQTNRTNEYDLIDTTNNNKIIKKSKSLKKQKLDEKLRIDCSRINEAFVETDDDIINNNHKSTANSIAKYSTLKNRPRLTASQIEKEFYEYTLECSKRFGDLLQSDAQSNTISLDTFDYMETTTVSPKKPGVYSHNLKVKNKNRVSHIRTAFNSENKNLSSQIKISKMKSSDDVNCNNICTSNSNNNNYNNNNDTNNTKEQIWHI